MARHRFHRSEGGQVIPIAALLMIVIVGFAALILDGGRGYVDRRDLQGAADTAALAGANQLGSKLQQNGYSVNCAIAAAIVQASSNLPGTNPGSWSLSGCSSGGFLSNRSVTQDLTNDYTADVTANFEQVKVTLKHTMSLTFGIPAGFGPSMKPAATATAVNGSLPFALVLFRNNTFGPGIGDPNSNLMFSGSNVTLNIDKSGTAQKADAMSNEGICPKQGVIDFHNTGDQYTFAQPGIPTANSCGTASTAIINTVGTTEPINFPIQIPDPGLQPVSNPSACSSSPCDFTWNPHPHDPQVGCLSPGKYRSINVEAGTLILLPGAFEVTGQDSGANTNFEIHNGAAVKTADNLTVGELGLNNCILSAVPSLTNAAVSVIMDTAGSQGSNGDKNQLKVDSTGSFAIHSGAAYNNIALYVRETPSGDPCYYNFNSGNGGNPGVCGSQVINFSSGASYNVQGLIYGVQDNMTFAGATTGVAGVGQIFAWTLSIVGNGSLTETYDPAWVPFLQGLLH